MTDKELKAKIIDLEKGITKWAKARKVWTDACFRSYLENFKDEPNENFACITTLNFDGPLWRMFFGEMPDLMIEFEALVEKTDFYHEQFDSSTIGFYAKDEMLNQEYLDFFEWEWISSLIKPNYTSLYNEVFEYFNLNPKKFYSLNPRQLEILVSEIFRNQGYYTELGSGWNDGGVDMRLYQKDEIDQIVTLVQVKRYKETLPIGLESVAYLKSIVDEEKANRGLFITTSRYLPQAQNFAERQNRRLKLANSEDLQSWCDKVKTIIVRDKSVSLEDSYLLDLLNNPSEKDLIGRMVHSTESRGIANDFCMIVKDTPNVSLLMRLPTVVVENFDAPHNFQGSEMPLLNKHIIKNKTKENVFRAEKLISEYGSAQYFWGQQKAYFLWDGKPKYFDHID